MKKIKQENEKINSIISAIEEGKPTYEGHRHRLKQRFMLDEGRSMLDYELLELVLTYAIPRRDVKPLAKLLLTRFTSIVNVITAECEDLLSVKGVGDNAVVLLKVIKACCNKICWESLENKDNITLNNKNDVAEYCRSVIGHDGRESLLTIFLNAKGGVLGKKIDAVGTVNAVCISPRTIAEDALKFKAVSVIICHNHPSGDCTPSKSDIDMTNQAKHALAVLGIDLDDHIIISPKTHYSMREHFDISRF